MIKTLDSLSRLKPLITKCSIELMVYERKSEAIELAWKLNYHITNRLCSTCSPVNIVAGSIYIPNRHACKERSTHLNGYLRNNELLRAEEKETKYKSKQKKFSNRTFCNSLTEFERVIHTFIHFSTCALCSGTISFLLSSSSRALK
jgi:hypothetical protein